MHYLRPRFLEAVLFVKIFSLLPFWFLYGLCELTAIFAYHILRYRRDIVSQNLAIAFPEKSERERERIAKQFYRQFLQVFAEMIKAYRFTKQDWQERVPITNPEVVNKFLDAGVPVILMSGHTANWEWPGFSVSQQFDYTMEFLYKPIKKEWQDKTMLQMRQKHGSIAIPKDNAMREVIKRRKVPRLVGFISDQQPSMGTEKYWLDFLNRPTAFYVGAERIATLTQYAVFYVDTQRIARGRYEVSFRQIDEPPYEKGHRGIIAAFVKMLEATIHRNPADYLWSHRRWKYTAEQEKEHLAALKKEG